MEVQAMKQGGISELRVVRFSGSAASSPQQGHPARQAHSERIKQINGHQLLSTMPRAI
jgi:hypothetical protein